jgi:DNA mismatch repair ATPase MutL
MHPSVSFLIRDEDAQSHDNRLGREILRIPRESNTLSRFQNLFGRMTTSLLHHVTHTSACGTLKVSGWCGRGHHSRELQFLYINGRCCKRVSTLNRIIDNASAGPLLRVSAPSFSPFSTPNTSSLSSTPRMNNKDASSSLVVKNELLYVLDIVCSRESVDVLHERDKTLVEFSDWAIVQSTLSFAIKKALGIESAPSIALSSAPTATTTSSGLPFLSPEPYRSPQSNFFSPPLLPAARMGETRTTAVAQPSSSSRVLSSSSSFLSSPSSSSAPHRIIGCTDCNGHSTEVLEPPKSIVSAGVATDGTRKRRMAEDCIPQSLSPESKSRQEASSSSLLLSTTTPPHQLGLAKNRSPYFSSSSSSATLSLVTTPQLSHHLQSRDSAAFDAVGLSLKALIESGKGSVAAEVDFIPRIGSVAGRPGRATLARFGAKLDKDSVAFMAMLRARQATAPSTSSSFPTPPLHQYLPPLPPPASSLSSSGSQVTKDVLKKLSAPESMIGQLDKKFIACITGQQSREVVIIDQHAADERVRLELIEAAVFGEKIAASPFSSTPDRIALSLDGMDIYLTPVSDGSSDSQISYFSYTLAFDPPIEMLDSTPRERHLMRSHAELFRTWGWNVFLDDPLLPPYLRQLPRFFDVQLGISELREFVEFIGSSSSSVIPNSQLGENVANAQKQLFRAGLFPPCITRIMHSKACRGAIMFGDELSREECIELVQRLALCDLPFQCAHGRPSLIPLLSLAEEG